MKYDPEKHRQRSIRLKGYDYSQAGAYLVTVCSWNRECLFGEIVNGEVVLSHVGQMVEIIWAGLSHRYPGVDIDEFVVMPNHIHGIVVLTVGATPYAYPNRGDTQVAPYEDILGFCKFATLDDIHRHIHVLTPWPLCGCRGSRGRWRALR